MAATELVTTLKRNATKLIAQVQQEQEPLLITQHGLPAAYLVDVDSYDAMQARIEVLSHEQAKKKLQRWLK